MNQKPAGRPAGFFHFRPRERVSSAARRCLV